MRASIHQAVERAIAGLSKRHALRLGADEFEVRTLLPVASWRQHTEPCRQAGSLVVGEDSCGNVFLCAPDGSVSFWDHETDEETVLTATIEEFCDSLVEPTPVALRPEQLKSVWIDPEFLAEQRRKGMPNHALQRTRRERRGCNRCLLCAGSLSLGRSLNG